MASVHLLFVLFAEQHQLLCARWTSDRADPPVDEVVVLPAVAQLQDELLPEVGDGPQPAVVVVDQTGAQSQPVGQTAAGRRLQLEGEVLDTGTQRRLRHLTHCLHYLRPKGS